MFSANGVRPAQNNYLLDGIDNNTSNVDFLSGVAYVVKPPVDAVDEIKILTSSFSAEYGRAGGAVLNTTLKSGTNQLRGSVWEFNRNDALNANDFFANRAGVKKGEVPARTSSGSPAAVRSSASKTFWFADYEGSLIKQARTWVRTVPTALQRSSGFTNFSDLIIAAERHGRRRRPGAHASRAARCSIRRPRVSWRPGRWIRSPGSWRRAPASCAMRSPATRFRRAASSADALRADAALSGAEPAGVEQQLRGEPRPTRTTRTRSTSASITTSAPTIASSRATASRTTTRCGRRRSRATATAAGSPKATRRCASTASRRATRTCCRRR